MPESEPLTLAEAVELIDLFVTPARSRYNLGQPVHLTMSPGDCTAYVMTFVPPTVATFATPGEYPRITQDHAVLAVSSPSPTAAAINPAGAPDADYVARHLRLDNPYTLLAVGLVWYLMVADPDTGAMADRRAQAVAAYEHAPRLGSVLSEWDRTMLHALGGLASVPES